MRYWRYHSKHVLTNAFDLVGAAAAREDRLSDERPVRRKAGPTRGRPDEMIVAGWFTLYSKDREKPPFADRAPRPVEQCDASPRDRQHPAVAAPARSAGRYGT